MTKPYYPASFLSTRESSVMYVCTYCYYADNICECDDQIDSKEHIFLKITTTTELCIMTLYEDEFVEVKNDQN